MQLIKPLTLAALAAALLAGCAIPRGAYAATISQADCNYAIKKLEQYNAEANAHPGKRDTFEQKATYAYAEVCESAGLVTIYGYLQESPEASPEVQSYCADNARSRGEANRCLATGKLDEYETPHTVDAPLQPRDAAGAAAAKKAAAYKAAAAKKAAQPVDDLFGDLSSGKNGPRKQPTQPNRPAAGVDVSAYASQLQAAISSNLYDSGKYRGQRCTLRLSLDRQGMLLDAKTEGGDDTLCKAARAALQRAKLPAFPDDATYEVFKNASLDFRP